MPIKTRETDDGQQISHDSLCVGYYGGSGSHGQANINWLEKHHEADVAISHGAYYSKRAWLPDTEQFRELLESLDDYPVFDEEMVSEVESQWERAAWESWLRSALVCDLPEELDHATDLLTDSELFEAYIAAMGTTNTYPVSEYSGVYIDLKRMQDAFRQQVELALINHDRAEDGLPPIQ